MSISPADERGAVATLPITCVERLCIDGRDVSVAIVLPAFNEELTIAATIMEFHGALPGASIVVVDNNSTDSTRSCTLDAFAAIRTGVLLTESRQGKGYADPPGFPERCR